MASLRLEPWGTLQSAHSLMQQPVMCNTTCVKAAAEWWASRAERTIAHTFSGLRPAGVSELGSLLAMMLYSGCDDESVARERVVYSQLPVVSRSGHGGEREIGEKDRVVCVASPLGL